jgi:hypothetical protein
MPLVLHKLLTALLVGALTGAVGLASAPLLWRLQAWQFRRLGLEQEITPDMQRAALTGGARLLVVLTAGLFVLLLLKSE